MYYGLADDAIRRKIIMMLREPQTCLSLTAQQVAALYAHARAAQPAECCGLLGGTAGRVQSVYPLRNVARQPLNEYDAAPEDLFGAQRLLRERGETLVGIYHSHPRQATPQPSLTDVRAAYYPSAVCFIIGLGGAVPVLRAFWLDAAAESWERARYIVVKG